MLEYLLREEGLNAGLTNSPDFLRTSEGLLRGPSSSSSLSSVVPVGDSTKVGLEMTISAVLDRECEILRASGVRAVGEVVWDTGSDSVRWMWLPTLSGEPSLRKSIDRTAF